MDSSMNHFNLDQLHVAQQSRREKLRSQHCSPSTNGPQLDDYSSNLDVGQTGFNSGLVQVGDSNMRTNANIMYHHHHPVGCSSEILEYSSVNQAPGAMTSIDMIHPSPNGSLKTMVESNLESCGVWKNVSDNNSSEDTIGRYRKKNVLSMVSDQYGEMNNFTTQPYYQNALSDGVTTAVIGLQPNCNSRGSACLSWGSYGGDNEQVPIVPYGYQSDGGCLISGSNWNADMNLLHARSNQMVVDSHSQGLSLSLCSYPAGSMITESQYVNPQSQHIPQSIPLHNVATVAFLDSKPCNASNFTRTTGTALGPATNYHRQTGPLGPFTGYATILKCSKFLQPAQQLLDEYCGVIGKIAGSGIRTASDIDLDESGDLATAVNSIVSDVVIAGGITGSSAPAQQDSDEINKGAKNSPSDSYRPDYQAKKAKLLYMLEEVSRRYKQYYQQMRMVVSAFESVAGLAGATPYISLALKAVSSHFNHLNNAISDQLRQIKSFLVEDFSLPNSRIRDKGDLNSKRLKYNDHSFQKHNSSGSSMGLLEPQQHIWRPQRGLPERAVSVLRAWLFEHFLHPYPTDTDKHMLATQTGLTRSQVSNWFINARVRLWKPMVEEVHMLETKGVMERNTNQVEAQDVSSSTHAAANNVHDLKADHSLNKAIGMSMASVNLECPATSSIYETVGDDQEKHVQVDSHEMTTMNEGMLGNSRYYQHVHDIHGTTTGSISLTLGLRQSADQLNRLEHQPYLQHQDSIRQHLGGHATHEYGG